MLEDFELKELPMEDEGIFRFMQISKTGCKVIEVKKEDWERERNLNFIKE